MALGAALSGWSRRDAVVGLGAAALFGWSAGAAAATGLRVRSLSHAGARWRVAEVPLGALRLRLLGQGAGAPRPLTLEAAARWRRALGEAPLLLTNAGMFHLGGAPVGLHVEQGVERAPLRRGGGEGNFFLLPNGVFSVGPGGARVDDSLGFSVPSGQLHLATQSGPLLTLRGALHPAFSPSSRNVQLRSGVGVNGAGEVVFVISEGLVRFHDLATLFRDALGCPDALYLDGAISALSAPDRPEIAGHPAGYGGVLVVDAPPAAP